MAGRQLGVVSREQLYSLGLSDEQVRQRVCDGWLHPVHHNVFAVGHRALVPNAYLLAALLSAGDTAFLSHRTAAAVWDLRPVNTHEIEVTIPGNGRRRRTDLRLHRTRQDPHPDDIRSRGLLRVSSVPRMLAELAGREKPAELERLITQSVRRRLLQRETPSGRASLETALARHERRAGAARLAAALAAYWRVESHASQLEAAFDAFLAHHPDLPDPLRNVHIGPWEIDRLWPAQRLAIELDGRPYHVTVDDMERDRAKDADLQRRGYVPIRFTDFRFAHDPAGILGELRHWLRAEAG